MPKARQHHYDQVRRILGNDFISPREAVWAFGGVCTHAHSEAHADTLPHREILEWGRENNYMLVAGPTDDLNLLSVRVLDRSLFFSEKDWFEEKQHTFSRMDMIHGGQWFMLRKSDVPSSRGKKWVEQLALIADFEYVPNAAEVSYGMSVYRELRGGYPFKGFNVRTCSMDVDGHHVCIGTLNKQSLCSFYDYVDCSDYFIGLSSARQLAG